MPGIDWRRLYAENQAAIARAGIPTGNRVPPRASTGLPHRRSNAPTGVGDRSGHHVGGGVLVHVPHNLDPLVPAPLVCMLHGCTQDPAAFAAATSMNDAADRDGFVVVYPGQTRGRNAQGCWNWFLPEHQRRGVGEPEAIAKILRDLIAGDPRCSIDPGRVFVAGFSAGAAMAVILATCYPDLFEALAVHSGLAYRSARDLVSAFEVMARPEEADAQTAHAAMGKHARPIPSIVIHGTADRTVVPANAIQLLRQSMRANHLAAPESCDHHVARPTASRRFHVGGEHPYTQSRWTDTNGTLMHELIEIDGLGHAWSGGAPGGAYTDPRGPGATDLISTFFSLTTVGRHAG
jgi:poly(hydroxyalkanoate) depolymerase family esterase